MGRPETQNRTPSLGALSGISVLENAKERPSAWPSVVFMEPWSILDPLLTQATLLTRPNLFKEAPWVGQRSQKAIFVPPFLKILDNDTLYLQYLATDLYVLQSVVQICIIQSTYVEGGSERHKALTPPSHTLSSKSDKDQTVFVPR